MCLPWKNIVNFTNMHLTDNQHSLCDKTSMFQMLQIVRHESLNQLKFNYWHWLKQTGKLATDIVLRKTILRTYIIFFGIIMLSHTVHSRWILQIWKFTLTRKCTNGSCWTNKLHYTTSTTTSKRLHNTYNWFKLLAELKSINSRNMQSKRNRSNREQQPANRKRRQKWNGAWFILIIIKNSKTFKIKTKTMMSARKELQSDDSSASLVI